MILILAFIATFGTGIAPEVYKRRRLEAGRALPMMKMNIFSWKSTQMVDVCRRIHATNTGARVAWRVTGTTLPVWTTVNRLRLSVAGEKETQALSLRRMLPPVLFFPPPALVLLLLRLRSVVGCHAMLLMRAPEIFPRLGQQTFMVSSKLCWKGLATGMSALL